MKRQNVDSIEIQILMKKFRSIDNIMRTDNIFAQSYRMMHEEIQTQMIENYNIPELQLGFLTKKASIVVDITYKG